MTTDGNGGRAETTTISERRTYHLPVFTWWLIADSGPPRRRRAVSPPSRGRAPSPQVPGSGRDAELADSAPWLTDRLLVGASVRRTIVMKMGLSERECAALVRRRALHSGRTARRSSAQLPR